MMKSATFIFTVTLFLLAGCEGKKQAAEELVTVNLTASYPEKELVLQDFMDVEYVPLETTDEFITQGVVMAVGKEVIVVKNRANDGDIFLFDRKTGKGLRKINRKGQSGEEYSFINGIVLDETNNELFVNSTSTKKIFVYDLYGNFKRSLAYTDEAQYLDIANYDKDHLISYDFSGDYKDGEDRGDQCFHVIISKQDGSITRGIFVPFKTINSPAVRDGDGFAITAMRMVTPYKDDFLLMSTSSDTIYNYDTTENRLIPFLVKAPSIHAMDPQIFLTMGTITDRYYFMETMKKVFDFKTGKGFFTSVLMYDKQEKAFYTGSVLNGDYTKKQKVDMTSRPVNNEIAAFQSLSAPNIVEAYEKGELKGRLKEIAATLDEESNPVIMVMKYPRLN